MDLEKRLRLIVKKTELLKYLMAIREAAIPDAWLVGGALRNTVWKELYPECNLEVNDIDVPFFSKSLSKSINKEFVIRLEKIYPTGKWEVDNQAWVHTYQPRANYWMPHAPYGSLEDSMQDFWFSVNTIGLRLNDKNQIEILNPEALEDLFNGILRVLPYQKNNPHTWFEEKIVKITSKCSNIKVLR